MNFCGTHLIWEPPNLVRFRSHCGFLLLRALNLVHLITMPLQVSESEKQELLCSLACLILQDDKAPITEENINKLVSATGATIEPYWAGMFAKLLEGKDVSDLLLSGGGAAPVTGGAAPAGATTAAEAAPVEAEPESEEESDADMGFSLFD